MKPNSAAFSSKSNCVMTSFLPARSPRRPGRQQSPRAPSPSSGFATPTSSLIPLGFRPWPQSSRVAPPATVKAFTVTRKNLQNPLAPTAAACRDGLRQCPSAVPAAPGSRCNAPISSRSPAYQSPSSRPAAASQSPEPGHIGAEQRARSGVRCEQGDSGSEISVKHGRPPADAREVDCHRALRASQSVRRRIRVSLQPLAHSPSASSFCAGTAGPPTKAALPAGVADPQAGAAIWRSRRAAR